MREVVPFLISCHICLVYDGMHDVHFIGTMSWWLPSMILSMFSLFGTKFVKLYCGLMWQVETTFQESQVNSSSERSHIKVLYESIDVWNSAVMTKLNFCRQELMFLICLNIHCRDIATSGVTTGAEIQVWMCICVLCSCLATKAFITNLPATGRGWVIIKYASGQLSVTWHSWSSASQLMLCVRVVSNQSVLWYWWCTPN